MLCSCGKVCRFFSEPSNCRVVLGVVLHKFLTGVGLSLLWKVWNNFRAM